MRELKLVRSATGWLRKLGLGLLASFTAIAISVIALNGANSAADGSDSKIDFAIALDGARSGTFSSSGHYLTTSVNTDSPVVPGDNTDGSGNGGSGSTGNVTDDTDSSGNQSGGSTDGGSSGSDSDSESVGESGQPGETSDSEVALPEGKREPVSILWWLLLAMLIAGGSLWLLSRKPARD